MIYSGVSLGHEPHVAVSALASYFHAGCSQPTVPSSLTGSSAPERECVIHAGVSLGQRPHVAVAALASYFQAGCSQATVPCALTGSTVVQQVVAVGQKLIHLHQVAHMHHLLALAGEAADTPGAAFLRVSLFLC